MTNDLGSSSGEAVETNKIKPGQEKNVSHKHFYQNNLLVTKASAQGNLQIFRLQNLALAQLEQQQAPKVLLTDGARSVIGMPPTSMTYSPYGHLDATHSNALLAYNGYWYDPITQGYPLGNGYRLFSPHLMRFCCQDSMSPFGRGGLNAYAYCIGDPVNSTDANGHYRLPFLKRNPISKLNHYNIKKQVLTDKKTEIKNRITHYKDKIQNLKEDRNKWRIQALANNSSDRHGNQPSDYVADLKFDINRNEAKLIKQDNKLKRLEERIIRNHEKILKAQQLVASQVPETDNELPAYTTPSQHQARVRGSI